MKSLLISQFELSLIKFGFPYEISEKELGDGLCHFEFLIDDCLEKKELCGCIKSAIHGSHIAEIYDLLDHPNIGFVEINRYNGTQIGFILSENEEIPKYIITTPGVGSSTVKKGKFYYVGNKETDAIKKHLLADIKRIDGFGLELFFENLPETVIIETRGHIDIEMPIAHRSDKVIITHDKNDFLKKVEKLKKYNKSFKHNAGAPEE